MCYSKMKEVWAETCAQFPRTGYKTTALVAGLQGPPLAPGIPVPLWDVLVVRWEEGNDS